MKSLFATLLALGLLSTAGQAAVFDTFNQPRLALPRSADEVIDTDKFREALPRSNEFQR
jgi:hypothetical protein